MNSGDNCNVHGCSGFMKTYKTQGNKVIVPLKFAPIQTRKKTKRD